MSTPFLGKRRKKNVNALTPSSSWMFYQAGIVHELLGHNFANALNTIVIEAEKETNWLVRFTLITWTKDPQTLNLLVDPEKLVPGYIFQ